MSEDFKCQADDSAKGEGSSEPAVPLQSDRNSEAFKNVVFAVWCKSMRESMVRDGATREVFDEDWIDYLGRPENRKQYTRIGGCIETVVVVLDAANAQRQIEEDEVR